MRVSVHTHTRAPNSLIGEDIVSIDEAPSSLKVRHDKLLAELRQKVATTLTEAGLALFPAGEEGSDPGGVTMNVDDCGVVVGWFTSDALIDRNPGEEFIRACEAAMVNAMAAILTAAGMSVTLRPWDFDGETDRTSLYITLNS
jgi:hypothetical protein